MSSTAAIACLLKPDAFLNSIQNSNPSCIPTQSAPSVGYVNLGSGALAESSNAAIARLLKEPDAFLDFLPDFDPCIPVDEPVAEPATTAASPTESSAAMEISIESAAETTNLPSGCFQWGSSCSWRYCHCPDCCWRTWGRRRHRPHPPSHFVGASTADAAPAYSCIFSSVQSIGSSLYSSLSRLHSLPSSHGPSNPQPPEKRRPSALDKYESKLDRVRWAARSVGSLYNLSTFLAVCSLTWSTVVLLGAFVSDLPFIDYAMVTSLVLLEAIRLGSAAFFTILLTHGLARQSQDPENIIHGKDDQYRRAFAARILSSILQAIMILPSFVCPIIRFPNIRYPGRNLHLSLLIFYTFIIINATASSFTLICSSASFIHFRDRYDQSVLRFYDELVQRAIFFGVIRADEFGFFEFAYRMLGSEYARIVQPEAVVKNHRKLIEYLYRHRLGQDFLAIFMDDGDAFVQQCICRLR
ncbi:hypothetical protein GOP47_0010857 [Adiantum capillus-veneris]|uniref:Uncharacterized protein n=1 Tax=Adiantum capillus-veneris TaxID=13818 RepID=A0A9D4UVW7_ADICA|nr:hypothetical protein GOP47_0010857 [Adiantum capillus-veneris]